MAKGWQLLNSILEKSKTKASYSQFPNSQTLKMYHTPSFLLNIRSSKQMYRDTRGNKSFTCFTELYNQ